MQINKNLQSPDATRGLPDFLRSGAIPMCGGDIAVIYATRSEFGGEDVEQFRLFAVRLKSARKNVLDGKQRAVSEAAALEHDRLIHPIRQIGYRGVPRWEGSEAQMLLKADIASGMHDGVKPSILHHSRDEYMNYPLDVFRGHIHQEQKLQKFIKQYGSRGKGHA